MGASMTQLRRCERMRVGGAMVFMVWRLGRDVLDGHVGAFLWDP